jgi:hypothetical protein
MANIRITRTLVFEGEEAWVSTSVDPTKALVSPDKPFVAGSGTITETSRMEEKLNG